MAFHHVYNVIAIGLPGEPDLRADAITRVASMMLRRCKALRRFGAKRQELKIKQFAQALGLSAADRHFGLFLVVHAELVRALEPRHNFADAVDVHEV